MNYKFLKKSKEQPDLEDFCTYLEEQLDVLEGDYTTRILNKEKIGTCGSKGFILMNRKNKSIMQNY